MQLKKFATENKKLTSTLMGMNKINSNNKDQLVNSKHYWNIIGSFIYFTTSELDILFFDVLCDYFQSSPKESHLTIAKASYMVCSNGYFLT